MKFSLATLALLSSASALSLPSSILGLSFSASCQQALLGLVTTSNFTQCVPVTVLLPLLTATNASIIPYLDTFMSDVCYSAPCSNATLMAAASTVLAGCSSDLAGEGLSNSTVMTAFSTYPVVREVLCEKTLAPYTNATYGGVLGNAPIPITPMTYNSTGGYFCITSLLTQLSAYFGTSPSVSFIEDAVTGGNSTAVALAKNISTNIICDECVFGAIDIIEEAYPAAGSVKLSTLFGLLNKTAPTNTTINGFVNGTCAYVPLSATMNGTLPANITVSIINSTFPYNITN